MRDASVRTTPAGLGYAAVLPFVGGAVAVWTAHGLRQEQAATALSAYAATVVSFLGGVYWGFGMRTPTAPATSALFVWGVVPSLAAWAALLLPVAPALALHGAMLSACFLVDRTMYPRHGAGAWLPLRRRLTAIAVPACLLASWGAPHVH